MLMSTILLLASGPVLAAPASDLWPFWQQSDETNDQAVDHTLWQTFLDAHLSEHDDAINRVDYAAASEPAERQKLNAYIESLTNLDPRTLRKAEQFAYWVNLYNALTVEVVLRYPKKKSILRMGEKFLRSGPGTIRWSALPGKTSR